MTRREAHELEANSVKPHQAIKQMVDGGDTDYALEPNEAKEHLLGAIMLGEQSESVENLDEHVYAGIYRSPDEETLRTVYNLSSLSHEDVLNSQIQAAKGMLKLHLDMKSQNDDYFKNLVEPAGRVLCGKNLASEKTS